jgi:serine protease Do
VYLDLSPWEAYPCTIVSTAAIRKGKEERRMKMAWWTAALAAGVLGLAAISPARGDQPGSPDSGMIEQAKQATVGILQDAQGTDNQARQGHFSVRGTGFHIGDGYIVTARHAVERDEEGKKVIPGRIMLLTTDLDELPATLTGMNAFVDIAVYRVNVAGLSPLRATVSFAEREPQTGDATFTVGYPLGWGPAMGFGHIGNPNTFLATVETRLFQIDLSACSGNSGGGLFDAQGKIVGVMHAIIQTETIQGERRCSRFAFAIPGRLVQRVVPLLIQGIQPQFSRLGVQMTAAKLGTKWRVAVSEATGPALEAGLRKGDILLAIEDTDILDAAQLKNYVVERTSPGQRVAVRIMRDDKEQVLYVTLGKS